MTFELWGIAGLPPTLGIVVSNTPKSFFFIGFASRSQLSARRAIHRPSLHIMRALSGRVLTEISDEVGRERVRSPLAVGNVSVLLDDETVTLVAFRELVESTFMLVDRLDPLFVLVVPVTTG